MRPRGNPSLVLAALKQTFAHRLLRELRVRTNAQTDSLWNTPVAVRHVWQSRFYDFVVFTDKKRVEKLRYMHRNPVQRRLVSKPEEWLWSSFRHYAYEERGPVLVNETRKAELRIRKISRIPSASRPTRETATGGASSRCLKRKGGRNTFNDVPRAF